MGSKRLDIETNLLGFTGQISKTSEDSLSANIAKKLNFVAN